MKKDNILYVGVFLIIGFIIILSFIGDSSNDLVNSGNNITDANTCSDNTGTNGEALTFNTSTKLCDNSTNPGVADFSSALPLSSLFASDGVAMLILMAGLLILLVWYVFKKRGMKQ